MRIPVNNIGDWLPKPTLPESKQPAVNTGELKVAESREYKPTLDELRVVMELTEIVGGPGMPLGILDKKSRLEEFRALSDVTLGKGIRFDGPNGVKVEDVAHPAGTPDNPVAWDPFTYMPRFIFEPGEDALPVSPSFDGDADLDNDAPKDANGAAGHYKDGVIGKNQALSGGFAVSQKGEYTVHTYSFYFATNKAGNYHRKDWSHAQVYLKPDSKGELKPEFLYTSWHHGAFLTPWADVKKDAQGKPVVEVQLGSHAVSPLSKDQAIPTKGLQIQGDGQALLNGEIVPHQLTWDAFQGNVKNAKILVPDSDAFKTRLLTMRLGKVAFDPIMPEVFFQEAGLGKVFKEKAKAYLEAVIEFGKTLSKSVINLWNSAFN